MNALMMMNYLNILYPVEEKEKYKVQKDNYECGRKKKYTNKYVVQKHVFK